MQRPLLFLVFGQRSMDVPRAKRPSCFILRGRSVFFVTHGSTFKISERCRRRWRWSGCHAAALMGSPVRAGYRFQIVSQQQTRIKLDGDGRAPIFSRWCSDMTQRVKFDHPPPVAVAGCLGDPLALWPNRAATVSHVCHEPLPLLVVNSDRGRLPRRVVSGVEPVLPQLRYCAAHRVQRPTANIAAPHWADPSYEVDRPEVVVARAPRDLLVMACRPNHAGWPEQLSRSFLLNRQFALRGQSGRTRLIPTS